MKVGPYEVLRKLGEGAYGKVYLARKGDASGFATWYALKRIARGKGRGPEFESYLFREARLGGIVNHPNLVRVHEVLSMPREWVLVQDYVDGVTLQTVLERRRNGEDPVPRAVALELGAELLETLHYLHTLRDPEGRQSGFIHRDVKPGNVMLSAGHLKVMDFGVARGEEAGAGTLAGELRGTLAYMAPEQATGAPVGPASDQFAAGLILLEMLSNGSPWGDVRGPAVLGRVVTGDVSAGLATLDDDDPVMPIVMRMLGRDPEARFPTARSAARALRALRAQTPTPPALRDFCSDEVERYRDDDDPELDQNPSWTGAWQWVSGGAAATPCARWRTRRPFRISSRSRREPPRTAPSSWMTSPSRCRSSLRTRRTSWTTTGWTWTNWQSPPLRSRPPRPRWRSPPRSPPRRTPQGTPGRTGRTSISIWSSSRRPTRRPSSPAPRPQSSTPQRPIRG